MEPIDSTYDEPFHGISHQKDQHLDECSKPKMIFIG